MEDTLHSELNEFLTDSLDTNSMELRLLDLQKLSAGTEQPRFTTQESLTPYIESSEVRLKDLRFTIGSHIDRDANISNSMTPWKKSGLC